MADKEPEEKDNLLGLINKLWSPIAGLIGGITLVYNFYKLWQGDQSTFTYLLVGGGLIILFIALGWVGFSKKDIPKRGNRKALKSVPRFSLLYRRIAWSGLAILTLLAVFGINILIQHRTEQENKLQFLIAAFEGAEDVYGLRNEIIENLNADFSGDENIEIISIDEIVTLSKGSEYARKLGGNNLADIVIWGWYRPTENPNVNIHIENLSPNQLLPLKESETFQPVTTLSELESFSFQQQTGDETSALVSIIAGYIEYKSENYGVAIQYFDTSLETLPVSSSLFESRAEIYFYRGNSNSYINNYEQAIQDYSQVIQINPQLADPYNNRGVTYGKLDEHELAIQDFDQAIQINPQNAYAYYNRGISYDNLDEYEHAVQDYEKAIQINPQLADAYNNRGVSYGKLDEHELAIQDFDQALEINPQYADAYNNRGVTYGKLDEYERAIQDFDQALQLNPQYADAYYNRGVAYDNLGEHELAIQDFDQALQLNPQDTDAYNNRGVAYGKLGEYERAIRDFDEALQINPEGVDAYSNRGKAYYHLGKYELAVQDFNQALQINPQFANAYYGRGLVYQALEKTVEAEADFAKYKELTGQDAP